MDEDTQVQAENTTVAEDSNVDASPAVEEQTSEEQVTEGQSEQEQVEAPDTETQSESERKPTRAERRIRDLVEENKRLKEQSNQFSPQDQSLQFPQYEPGEEIQPERLQQDVVQTANAIAQLQTQNQIQQFEARTNLDKDVEVLPAKFPELDENSPNYNPVLEEKISEAYKARAFKNGQLDPSVRLADVAQDFIDVARAAAKQSSADMRNAVAKQADETAVRPTTSAKSEKTPDDMSIEELEAKLGFHRI